MKFFFTLLIAAVLFGGSHSAFGDSLDFKAGVLDPPTNPDPILPLTDIQTTSPFNVVFGGCPASIGNPPVAITANGCFLGLNDTGQTITSLFLTFDDTTSADPNDPDALNGQDADCQTTSVFVGSSSICGISGGSYNLLFSGAAGLPPGAFFVITETGPNPDAFQGGTGVITITPEPDSFILLSTGIMMMAAMFLFRRSLSASR